MKVKVHHVHYPLLLFDIQLCVKKERGREMKSSECQGAEQAEESIDQSGACLLSLSVAPPPI